MQFANRELEPKDQGMKLPFLKESKWPVLKETEERVANPSHDTQLQDHLVEEILISHEHKDHRRMREALMALIRMMKNEESNADVAA
jgi:hypothetical protein